MGEARGRIGDPVERMWQGILGREFLHSPIPIPSLALWPHLILGGLGLGGGCYVTALPPSAEFAS